MKITYGTNLIGKIKTTGELFFIPLYNAKSDIIETYHITDKQRRYCITLFPDDLEIITDEDTREIIKVLYG